ncbi:CDP-diacylglycerol--glycerol-3-phosphate 3-phosphatidyltransferase [Candidatus Sulfopaludibacter sp. SbA4]|nr:CDP-diacylglycerol--glycerol-3-phosphate 3-phosphatidyltransferase [Candidatus Sulfopaludibacter sp. SbA4]
MPRWINLPNLFTLLRLVLVPFVMQAILQGRYTLALALFGIAAVTDILDGAAARRLGLSTQAGAYLDPVADKCLLSGVFLALAVGKVVPWWFVGVVFGRDLYILLGVAGVMLFTPVRKFPPSLWGKVSTFVQILTVVACLARNALELRVLDALSPAILWLCVVFTAWSGLHYTWRGFRVARAH